MKFNQTEKRLIELAYNQGSEMGTLSRALKLKETEINHITQKLFKKMSVNCWHNAIRRAFEIGLLSRSRYSTLDLEVEAEAFVERICNLDLNKYNSDLEAQLAIYYELVDLYNKYEYNYLLGPKAEASTSRINPLP